MFSLTANKPHEKLCSIRETVISAVPAIFPPDKRLNFLTLLYVHLSIIKRPLMPSAFSLVLNCLSLCVFLVQWLAFKWQRGLKPMCVHSAVWRPFKRAAVLSKGVKEAWDLRRCLISHSVNGVERLWPLWYASLKSNSRNWDVQMC